MPYKEVIETVLIDGKPTNVMRRISICRCGSVDAEVRYSLGIYAGIWCDPCWDRSGYRKEGPSGFDPLDAGEAYGEDDY